MVSGDGHLGHIGACPGEDVNGGQHQVAHVALCLVEALLEHADPQPGHSIGQPTEHIQASGNIARLAGIVGVVPRGGLERRRRVLHGAGHRTRVVDGLVRAEPDPEVRHEPERGLVADDPAERGGNADGAALVAAEGDVDLARGHGRARTRRRSAGHVLAVVRIEGPAVIADGPTGAEAATQPIHHVLADDGAARLQDAGDHGGVEVGNEAVEGKGAEAHRHSGDRDMVLEADRLILQQTFGSALDAALPHPGIEGVFVWTRPPTRFPAGRDHRRPGLFHSRLHEGVELAQLFREVLSVEDGLVRTQMDAQLLGHRHDFIDVRDRVHRLLSCAEGCATQARFTPGPSLKSDGTNVCGSAGSVRSACCRGVSGTSGGGRTRARDHAIWETQYL